jgi:hypothetical protein
MGNLSKVPHTYFTTVIIYFPILVYLRLFRSLLPRTFFLSIH